MTEDDCKEYIKKNLVSEGWNIVNYAPGHVRGVDIEAIKNGNKIFIEVKGCGSRPQMRVNYFLSIIGEILQRMNDEKASYYIAFPNIQQYKNLWERFPKLAKTRTNIKMMLVSDDGKIQIFD